MTKNTGNRLSSVLFIVGITAAAPAVASEASLEAMVGMSMEDLLDMPVTTVSKAPQRMRESPGNVRIITAEQIRQRGYLTLEDLFSDLPGFQFRNILGFNSYVFMRGAASQNNLILLLVDGVEINELNSGGFYGGGQFNLDNIKRVEVVYGPASTLYGTNAMSGVINIITREVDDVDAQGTWVSAAAGNFDTGLVDFRSAGYDQEQRFGYSISGRYFTSEKANLAADAGDNNWTDAMQNFEHDIALDGKLRYRDFDLGLVYQNKQASRTTNYKTVGSNKLDRDSRWNIRFLNLWLKHKYNFSADLSLKSKLYFQDATVQDDTVAYIQTNSDANCSSGPPGCQVGYYRPNSLLGIEEQLNYRFNADLDLIAGLTLEKEDLSTGFSKTYSNSPTERPPTPARPARVDAQLLSIYAQGQYRLMNDLSLTLGLRHDDSNIYGVVDTPRAGLVFNRDRLTWKLLYAEAFRAPKRWDLTFGAGNPNLRPEAMRSLETTFSYRFSRRINGELAVYNNRIDDRLVKDRTGNRWINQGELNTLGTELSLSYIAERLSSEFNYSYTDSQDENNQTVPEIARHTFNLGATWALDRHLKINLRGNYLGSRKNPVTILATGNDIIDAAFVLHANLGYENYHGWNFNLIVRNLLDSEYYHSSNRPPERYRQAQRNWLLKLGYAF